MELVCASDLSVFKLCAFSGGRRHIPPAILATWKPDISKMGIAGHLGEATCLMSMDKNRIISSHNLHGDTGGSVVIHHNLEVLEDDEDASKPKIVASCTAIKGLELSSGHHVGLYELPEKSLFLCNNGNVTITSNIRKSDLHQLCCIGSFCIGRSVTSCALDVQAFRMAITAPRDIPSAIYNLESQKISWEADNDAVDFLGMRIPVWDLDCSWINRDLFSCSSAYGRVYIYDIRSSRKPMRCLNIVDEVSSSTGRGKYQRMTRADFPLSLKRISTVPGASNHAIVASNTGEVYSIDLFGNGPNIVNRLKGPIGTTRDILCTSRRIVIAGIDRYIRVYDSTNYEPFSSLYVKSMVNRLMQVDVLSSYLRKGASSDENGGRVLQKQSASEIIALRKSDRLWRRLRTGR